MMGFGILSHLLYGGVFGVVLAAIARPVMVGKGLLFGVALWLLMQVVWLPFLGWGMFGAAATPMIAGATLVLYLIYGAVLGWLVDRR